MVSELFRIGCCDRLLKTKAKSGHPHGLLLKDVRDVQISAPTLLMKLHEQRTCRKLPLCKHSSSICTFLKAIQLNCSLRSTDENFTCSKHHQSHRTTTVSRCHPKYKLVFIVCVAQTVAGQVLKSASFAPSERSAKTNYFTKLSPTNNDYLVHSDRVGYIVASGRRKPERGRIVRKLCSKIKKVLEQSVLIVEQISGAETSCFGAKFFMVAGICVPYLPCCSAVL